MGGVVVGLIESVELGWKNPLVELSLGTESGTPDRVHVIIEERSQSPMWSFWLYLHSRTFTGANLLTLFYMPLSARSFFSIR